MLLEQHSSSTIHGSSTVQSSSTIIVDSNSLNLDPHLDPGFQPKLDQGYAINFKRRNQIILEKPSSLKNIIFFKTIRKKCHLKKF